MTDRNYLREHRQLLADLDAERADLDKRYALAVEDRDRAWLAEIESRQSALKRRYGTIVLDLFPRRAS